ncbi:uncharacterized protein N7483_013122 [Penicillium malachiteum]|uniref:uncharacterized protein n=1 Tax=Penicillium malachiteum TaxID=1324776 RepID=UPI0025499957|nr:uncharacterized protein N7483_013122 [Penicillium malachiteum]KAJ5715941.1 hypothetical protein N7483_013122 [Penicillium malachiteum]
MNQLRAHRTRSVIDYQVDISLAIEILNQLELAIDALFIKGIYTHYQNALDYTNELLYCLDRSVVDEGSTPYITTTPGDNSAVPNIVICQPNLVK